MIKFNGMTEELAKLEGDLSLEYWRKVHYEFFKSFNPKFTDEDLIIFEIFEVINNRK